LNIVPDLMRLAEGVRITELKSVDVLRGWREHCASIVEANWRFALGHDGRAGINQWWRMTARLRWIYCQLTWILVM